MVDQNLVRTLLMQLEREYGRPIQLAFITPENINDSNKFFFGDFRQRSFSVLKPISFIDSYENAFRFVSGRYNNFDELNNRIISTMPKDAQDIIVNFEGIYHRILQNGASNFFYNKFGKIEFDLIR